MRSFFPAIENKTFVVKILWLLIITAVSFLLFSILGILIAFPFFGSDVLELMASINKLADLRVINFHKYFQLVSQMGTFVIPSLVFGWMYNHHMGSFLKLNSSPRFWHLIVSILAIIMLIPGLNFLLELNQELRLPSFLSALEQWMLTQEDQLNRITEAFLYTDSFTALLANILIMAVFAAIGEELFFRGVIQQLLNNLLRNHHWAILITSIIFSAFHLQFFGFLPRMLMGIMLGYIFIWTNNLWIPIILHFLFNSISIVAAYAYSVGIIGSDLEAFGSSENFFLIMLSFLLSFFLLLLVYKKRESVRSRKSAR